MNTIELIKALILGIIEGITEWLPVSSTGHMILVDEFLRLGMSGAFKEMFFVVIQLGAIIAVVLLYRKKLIPASLCTSPAVRAETLRLWLKIAIACVPAAVIGFLFDDMINELFFNYRTVALTLIFYGILFILADKNRPGELTRIETLGQLDYKTALFIGLFQTLSLIPGTSRSGATILGAIMFGVSRTAAAEFSFFLAIPIMLGASLLKIQKFGFSFSGGELLILLTGAASAFFISLISIKFLIGYVKNHSFRAFGFYRIALGIAVLLYFLNK